MIAFSRSTLEIHSPPLFYEVLGAVHDLDVAVLIDRGDVASAEPSVHERRRAGGVDLVGWLPGTA